jgi:hypothetical protein
MVEEVREAMDEGNAKFFGGLEYHILSTVTSVEPQRIKEESLQVVDT